MLYYYSQRNASADLGRVNVGRDGHEGHAWAGAEADGEAQNGSKSAIVAKATVNEDFMAVISFVEFVLRREVITRLTSRGFEYSPISTELFYSDEVRQVAGFRHGAFADVEFGATSGGLRLSVAVDLRARRFEGAVQLGSNPKSQDFEIRPRYLRGAYSDGEIPALQAAIVWWDSSGANERDYLHGLLGQLSSAPYFLTDQTFLRRPCGSRTELDVPHLSKNRDSLQSPPTSRVRSNIVRWGSDEASLVQRFSPRIGADTKDRGLSHQVSAIFVGLPKLFSGKAKRDRESKIQIAGPGDSEDVWHWYLGASDDSDASMEAVGRDALLPLCRGRHTSSRAHDDPNENRGTVRPGSVKIKGRSGN
ncbi:hypothetical protein DFH08DRAFT_814876 [Mycena albidolilacea]|uniref:Uncharacterized protein n=1 Tax=Mycena albidolilacea TaxID=1033008 RepID=A0AAD6ZPC8_9AGAR|nr:hypothetical protein DFH08DRAFT_814876 [Mycena albidolilacea]